MAVTKKHDEIPAKKGKTASADKKERPVVKKTGECIPAPSSSEPPAADGEPARPDAPGRHALFTAGEFRGDFTRDTFSPANHFTRVLMQQGRIGLDADWNEQTAILLHYLQTLAADLIGPCGGPSTCRGFEIKPDRSKKYDFAIGAGRYYIDGLLCENENEIVYTGQWSSPDNVPQLEHKKYLVYLDAWERNVSCIEDPDIREVALNGADTATRAKVEWVVRSYPETTTSGEETTTNKETCLKIRESFMFFSSELQHHHGRLKATGKTGGTPDSSGVIHPESRYRGSENRLYRVEIHKGGTAGTATFKWSRKNGTVQFPIIAMHKDTITLAQGGREESPDLKPGDLVEIIDDDSVKQGYDLSGINNNVNNRKNARGLFEVKRVDPVQATVTLTQPHGFSDTDTLKHPQVRRWDHTAPRNAGDNCIAIAECMETGDTTAFELEEGIKIQFHPQQGQSSCIYVPGNYWLIPARVATGDIDWPRDENGVHMILPPHGVIHHYAPLGIISVERNGDVSRTADCRYIFSPHCRDQEQSSGIRKKPPGKLI